MRRTDREITDLNEINHIIEKGTVVHVAMIDDNRPYIVPLNYGYTLDNGKLTLYVHSALKGRKIDVISKNNKVCIEISHEMELVGTGDIACEYGCLFASVIGDGTASFIEDNNEKEVALQLLMKQYTNKDNFIFDEKMLAMVSVIKIDVETYTCKSRKK